MGLKHLARKLMGKSKITFLGRAGLVLHMEGTTYFVDCEMMNGETDVAIFPSHITLNNDRTTQLDSESKERVLATLIKELKNDRIKFTIG